SAAASWCSGFMFIGQIGFTYQRGISSIWIMLGLLLGDLFVSQITHRRLRVKSQEKKQESYVEALIDNSGGLNLFKLSTVLVSLIAIISLVGYSSAQIMSSGIALESILGFDYKIGAILTTVLITLYCFSGGIRASIWTDFIQSLVMVIALLILVGFSFQEVGGIGSWIEEIKNSPSSYLSLFPPDLYQKNLFFLFLIFVGWFAGGMGVAGQPHVMVRFMTLKDVKLINRSRAYYYSYYTLLYTLAILIGLSARIILPELESQQYEMALPLLSKKLLPDFLIGIILAGLFASTMSTADSLIISSSATLTRDLFPKLKNSYVAVKVSTILVATVACLLAIYSQKTVFQMVIIFGGLLSASFAPILILKSLDFKIRGKTLIAMIIVSAISVNLWRELSFSSLIYEVAIGMASGLIVGIIGSKLSASKPYLDEKSV
ncbi:MAG: sodium/proline symporter, partial [Halobacteriovoraceae bacterium]|nr:sodium/proline symporter [Halobacteriovoraceae bacterium]